MKIFEAHVSVGGKSFVFGRSRSKQHLEKIVEALRAVYPEWREYVVVIK